MIVSNVDDSNRDLVYTTIKTMGDSLGFFEENFFISSLMIRYNLDNKLKKKI